ncbi:hypothetical protein EGT07_01380 [Herbaspirillum sp. HC18]|nr:hypothetical protein EGT07_01380 [Herbaspirillum sp. HC18]
MATNDQKDQAFSLERVSTLVAALEQELAAAPADLPKAQALRQEIEALKQVLATPGDQQVEVKEKLHSVRSTLQDMTARVESEVLQDSRYVAEIGRILGLM